MVCSASASFAGAVCEDRVAVLARHTQAGHGCGQWLIEDDVRGFLAGCEWIKRAAQQDPRPPRPRRPFVRDELGYMELDRHGAELLSQELTGREEKKGVAIASNESS
ncbi:hypothetical protein GCM10023335_67210 [Streptomyces siamensis]|uniref:Uncharacterized protein n=1 Tax=Streptomyces siamensis TaxID=1274986 RepID=A0ABP9JFC6_9ACTN